MNQIDEKVKDAAIMCGQQTALNAERVAIVLIHFAEAVGVSIEQPKIKEEEPTYTKSFVRPRIEHQVLDRKPRDLIKKIIR